MIFSAQVLITAWLFVVLALFPVPDQKIQAEALSSPPGKTMTIGIAQEFETLNPVIHQMVASAYLMFMVIRPLTAIDDNWQWRCYLCTEMPSLENGKARFIEEDGKKKMLVEWEIHPKARWGDGTPVTGKDVKLGWEVGSSPNVMVGEKDFYTRVEDVILDPKNPKKVTLKFHEARYDFAQMGNFHLLPDHIERVIWEKTNNEPQSYEKQSAYSTNPTNRGLYSGPFVVKEIVLGSHLVLERNPYFFGDAANLKQVVVKLVPDTATLESNLLSGTIDMISELGLKLDQALALDKRIQANPDLDRRFQVIFRDGIVYEHVDLNMTNPLLQDNNLRRALVHAIDRDRLVKALFENKQKKAIHNVHFLDPYYTEDVVLYEYDPKKAEELLEASGWQKNSDGIRYKNGEKLSLVFMTTAQDKTRELVQVFLQSEWKKIGIDLKIRNEPARVYFGETLRKMKYPHLAMYAWMFSPDNPPNSTCHSSEIPTEKNGFNGQNRTAWSNAKVDEALDKIYGEFDLENRKKLMRTVLQEYTSDVPVIPLYYRSEIVVLPKTLKNYKPSGHQFMSSLQSEYWEK